MCWVCIRTSQEGLVLCGYFSSVRSEPVRGVCSVLRGSASVPLREEKHLDVAICGAVGEFCACHG